MEFNEIEDKEIIDYFTKLYKKISVKHRDKKYLFGRQIIKVEDFPKHLISGDEVGRSLLLAIKLFKWWQEQPDDFERNVYHQTIKNEKKTKPFNKDLNLTLVVVLPDFSEFRNVQIAFDKIFVSQAETFKFELKPSEISKYGEHLYHKNCDINDIREKCKNSELLYFTTITHGSIFGVKNNNWEDILSMKPNDRSNMEEICKNHHFNLTCCNSGLFLADYMIGCGAKHVQSYRLPLWINPDYPPNEKNRFVIACSKVDIALLNNKYHSEANEECKNEFKNQAIQVYNPRDPSTWTEAWFLLYNGYIKTHSPINSDSKLAEEPYLINNMHIYKIEMEKEIQNVFVLRKIRASAFISIINEKGKPVPNAKVSGHWNGNAINKSSGITNTSGKLTLTADWFWSRRGRFIFTVDNIEHKGLWLIINIQEPHILL